MSSDFDDLTDADEEYFSPPRDDKPRAFDTALLREPLTVLHTRTPLVFAVKDSASDAMRAMQGIYDRLHVLWSLVRQV